MQSRHFFLTILFFFSCLHFGFAQQSTVLNHGHGVSVLTVKFSPVDNNLVASVGDDNTIKLWDLQNGTTHPFRGHTATINSIAFSPTGNLLASGSADRTVRLWDVYTQQNIATLEDITDWGIQAVTFSPDGQQLAIADGGHDVILWNIHTQREIATLPNDSSVRSLAFSPNGQFLVAGGTVWNLVERKVITELEGRRQVVFSPDGKLFANCNGNGNGGVNLWDVRDWTLTAVLPESSPYECPVDITSDNKTLVTGRYLWSLETGQRVADLGWARTVSLSPDGKTVARNAVVIGTVRVDNIEAYLQTKLPDRFTLKLYYFLPNNRSPQPDIDATIEQRIKEAQHAFAEQMAHHGFGRKTFTYETDASGKAVVHHIKGQRNEAFYVNNRSASQDFLGWNQPPWASTGSTGPLPYRPDKPEDIHIVFVDVSSEGWASKCTSYYSSNSDRGGVITVLAQGSCVDFHNLIWILGNAFGLPRNSIKRFSGATERIELSYAAAEWLDAHRYFTTNPTDFNVPPTIEMLKPRAALTGSLHLSFKITDPDGLHQAQLRIPQPNNELLYLFGQMIGYKSLRGETKNVRFVTTELTPANKSVTLHLMDTYGNVTVRKFSIDTRTIKREPLPVTLSRFRADRTDSGVVLNWATESELNNAGFYILRSETKNGQFKVVNPTLIQGAGTTSERNTYTWTDTTAKPNTLYYYRIEDISHTGTRQQLATVRLRGLVSATGKMLTRWADLKRQTIF